MRGGSLVVVQLDLGDVKLQNLMLVEKCVHKYGESKHTMDLTVSGGDLVHDANDFVRAVQQVSTNANDAGYPATVMSGTVTSASPLKIKIEQRFEISGSMLILPEHLKEREIKVTVKPTHTEDGGTPEHNHEYGGELTVTVHSGLSIGDSVQVVRQQGGQKYLVIGKVV